MHDSPPDKCEDDCIQQVATAVADFQKKSEKCQSEKAALEQTEREKCQAAKSTTQPQCGIPGWGSTTIYKQFNGVKLAVARRNAWPILSVCHSVMMREARLATATCTRQLLEIRHMDLS